MTHPTAALASGDLRETRQHPRTAPLCLRGGGLLLLSLAILGCRLGGGVPAARRDLANLDRLLHLMEHRLTLMHDVARWKWNAGRPIADPDRERALLRSVVERGQGKGLDPNLLRSFFAAQMEAARLVQQANFDRWKEKKEKPPTGKSLAELRKEIDQLNGELIDALAEVVPRLSRPEVQRDLPQRAREILTGDGLDDVRARAIAPLQR